MRCGPFLVAALLLSACDDPMTGMERLSEQAVADDAPKLDVTQDDVPQGGYLGRLLGLARSGETVKAAETAEAQATENVEENFPDTIQAIAVEDPKPVTDQPRRGFMGRLLGRVSEAQDAQPDIPPSDAAEATPQDRTWSGTVLPYGVVGVVCDMPTAAMGRKIAQYPESAPRHVLYDSQPDTATTRSFYLTGFEDGCTRQFTAALAMFGTVRMHEKLRYGLPAEVQPYSDTDKAYETLKVRICGVDRRKPCGDRVSRLESDTVFLSIYENFGDNSRWSNLLLHGGAVLAQDLKEG